MDRRHCLASIAAATASFAWGAASPGGASASAEAGDGRPHPADASASSAGAASGPPMSPAGPGLSPERSTRALVALGDIESRTGGRLGVQVTDAAGGLLLSHRPDERFPMCSTFKALAAGAVLMRADRGEEKTDRRITFKKADLLANSPETQKHVAQGMTLAELCQAAVEQSDNAAANLVLASLGGPAGVTQAARALGDAVTRLDRTELSLNDAQPGDERDTTSPAAMADDLRQLLLSPKLLSFGSRQMLQRWMRNCKTGDDTLRAGLPPKTLVMNKTGMGDNGTRNDVGVFWLGGGGAPRVIAVYLTGAKVGRAEQAAAIAEVARTVVALLAV